MSAESLEARIEELERRVAEQAGLIRKQEDIEACKNLQKAYGFYVEHMMGQEIIDCFSKSEEVEIHFVEGTYLGQSGLNRYFGRMKADVSPELMHQVMQLSGIVTMEPDGLRAKGRWYAFGALAVPWNDGVRQTWMSSIYEMDYIKEDGVWKILVLRWNLIFNVPPEKGWEIGRARISRRPSIRVILPAISSPSISAIP
jgi:hypothetical protein